MKKAQVTICEGKQKLTIIYKGKSLPYNTFNKNNNPSKIVDSKNIDAVIDKRKKGHKPKDKHPWRQNYKPENKRSAA